MFITPQTNSDEIGEDYTSEPVEFDESNFEDIGELEEDALEYISGYLIRKLNLQEYQSKENSFTWVDEVAKGALKKPSNDFLEKIKKLEKIFYIRNGDKISHDPNILQDLVQCSTSIDLADNIKSLFFKCRIHFRIRRLNLNNKQE